MALLWVLRFLAHNFRSEVWVIFNWQLPEYQMATWLFFKSKIMYKIVSTKIWGTNKKFRWYGDSTHFEAGQSTRIQLSQLSFGNCWKHDIESSNQNRIVKQDTYRGFLLLALNLIVVFPDDDELIMSCNVKWSTIAAGNSALGSTVELMQRKKRLCTTNRKEKFGLFHTCCFPSDYQRTPCWSFTQHKLSANEEYIRLAYHHPKRKLQWLRSIIAGKFTMSRKHPHDLTTKSGDETTCISCNMIQIKLRFTQTMSATSRRNRKFAKQQ